MAKGGQNGSKVTLQQTVGAKRNRVPLVRYSLSPSEPAKKKKEPKNTVSLLNKILALSQRCAHAEST